jgi:hypothetical protein
MSLNVMGLAACACASPGANTIASPTTLERRSKLDLLCVFRLTGNDREIMTSSMHWNYRQVERKQPESRRAANPQAPERERERYAAQTS